MNLSSKNDNDKPYLGQAFLQLLWPGGILCPFLKTMSLFYLHPAVCFFFLKVCPKIDHMTHFGLNGKIFKCLRWLKAFF